MRYLYVIVDGLGFSQLERLRPPFLWQLGKEMSFRPVDTLLAYSSGIYPSMWSGRYPDDHLVWSEFFLDPAAGPGITDPLRVLPAAGDLQRRTKYLVLQVLLRLGIRPKDYFALPPEVERYFRRVASRYEELPPARVPGVDMISDVMDRAGHSWAFAYRGDFTARLPSAREIEDWLERDSLFLYISDMDAAGHAVGPGTESYHHALLRLDSQLARLVSCLRQQAPDLESYLFSDHGMNAVRATVDLWKHLNSTPCRLGRDYLAFFNSTVASLWFLSSWAERTIRHALGQIEVGRVLSDDDLNRYHLNFPDDRYGQAWFVCDPGVEIIPNFMTLAHRPSKGMHGYPPEDPETRAFLIAPRNRADGVRDVTDIFRMIESNVVGSPAPGEHRYERSAS